DGGAGLLRLPRSRWTLRPAQSRIAQGLHPVVGWRGFSRAGPRPGRVLPVARARHLESVRPQPARAVLRAPGGGGDARLREAPRARRFGSAVGVRPVAPQPSPIGLHDDWFVTPSGSSRDAAVRISGVAPPFWLRP